MDGAREITVRPTQFWRSSEFFEQRSPPDPFRVTLDPRITHLWAGRVLEPGHEFDGQTVYLSQRRREWTGEINVEIEPANQERFFSGYAHITPRPERPPLVGDPVTPKPPSDDLAPHEQLVALWAEPRQNYPRVVTHTEREIDSLAAHYGVSLPDDFGNYLLHACSTLDDGGDMDASGNAWWGLERIRSVLEECGPDRNPALAKTSDKTLVFADTLMWCSAWAICCAEGPDYGRIFLLCDGSHLVADSFTEFVEGYLTEDASIYGAGAAGNTFISSWFREGSAARVLVLGAAVVIIAVAAWFLFAGRAETPTKVDVPPVAVEAPKLPDINMPDAPILPKG